MEPQRHHLPSDSKADSKAVIRHVAHSLHALHETCMRSAKKAHDPKDRAWFENTSEKLETLENELNVPLEKTSERTKENDRGNGWTDGTRDEESWGE